MAEQLKIRDSPELNLDKAIAGIIDLLNDGKREWLNIRSEVGKIGQNLEKLTSRVYQIEDWSRKPFSSSTVKIYLAVVQKFFNGMCPCCGEVEILNRLGGRNDNLEIDHFKGPRWNKITEGWQICKICHEKLTHGYLHRDGNWVEQAFKNYQMRINQYTAAEKNEKQEQMFQ